MRKLMAMLLVVCTFFVFTGCSTIKDITASKDGNGSIVAVDGYADGRIGDTLKNTFFEYTVKSAQYVEEYAGYKPQEGNVLIDTVITTRNVFGEQLDMFAEDYQIQWDKEGDRDNKNNYGYPIEAIDDTMIPTQFKLAKGETKEYHCVYEVPTGYTDYSISYLEYFDNDTEGDVFFIFFELK